MLAGRVSSSTRTPAPTCSRRLLSSTRRMEVRHSALTQLIGGNVLYSQGSHPTIAPDGTVYVFWDGSTRKATLDSIWVTKSTDGGTTWSKPVAVSQLVDIIPVANTAFRNNSYPAAAVAPDGSIYVTWASMMSDATGGLCPARSNSGCHATVLYSKSVDGGATTGLRAPAVAFPISRCRLTKRPSATRRRTPTAACSMRPLRCAARIRSSRQ